MCGSLLFGGRLSQRGRPWRVGAAVCAALIGPVVVCGQAALDRRVNMGAQQTGRMLDVNPQVGGAGQNYFRPMSPLLGGNLSATGIAGRGMSLRSYSPIQDPTAFRAPLGSASLYDFRRDSVGVLSSPLGVGSLSRPYLDPSTTVPTGTFLQGLSGFGAGSGGLGAKPLDLRIENRIDLGGGPLPPPGADFLAPPGPLPPVPQPWADTSSRATLSSIFGPGVRPRLPLPTESPRWARTTPEPGAARTATGGPLSERVGGPPGGPTQPLSSALRSDLYPRLGPVPTDAGAVAAGKPGLILPTREPAPTNLLPPRVRDASVMPGYDVFTDMQLALVLLSDPNATWYDDMSKAVKEQPDLARQLNAQVLENSQAFVDKMVHTPLRSFTGGGPSVLNELMLKAESLMDIGHYAEAADRYEAASQMAPSNPLPLIGKGDALLAAGNYRSAALALLQGLARADHTPGLAAALFRRLDLTALMGGGEIIDMRRADIMSQLQQRETPELRFLLGYLEYHSGDRAHGLENLKRAAENPRADALIARYPALLETESPTLPSGEPSIFQPHETVPLSPAQLPESASQPTRPAANELVVPPRE